MKIVEFLRGGSPRPLRAEKDIFDSIAKIYLEDNRQIFTCEYANTDFCFGYNGGILAEGSYSYICGYRRDRSNKKVLFIFDSKYINKVNSVDDLKEPMRILPSLIPNPNHNGQKIITQVLVHSDSERGGYSHGCQTILPIYYQKFIDLFAIDEKGLFRLCRSSAWTPPDFYQGK